jgi:hypothetical protein
LTPELREAPAGLRPPASPGAGAPERASEATPLAAAIRPSPVTPVAADLERLDAAVEAAIDAGSAGPLRILGYGEITLVLGWPTEQPTLAVKRLPAFRHADQLARYAALLRTYTEALHERGVAVVPTTVRSVAAGDAVRAYLIQPLMPRALLLDSVLRSAGLDRGARLLERLAENVTAAVDERIGLDAQVANWVVEAGELACVDVSTPLMRSASGRDQLELEPFLSIYPALLRRALAPVAHSVMAQYHEPRKVLVDAASNLVKEQLERWLPVLLAAANDRVRPPITEAEVRAYFQRDRRLWLLMQRLRRLDRAWQRRVRGRPYPFLLPPPYRYGPPELPDRETPERKTG